MELSSFVNCRKGKALLCKTLTRFYDREKNVDCMGVTVEVVL